MALCVAGIGLADSVAKSGAAAVVFATPMQAYDKGITAWSNGETGTAIEALEYAAENGVLAAELKLADLYASGEGVPRDDARAFGYYQRIAMRYADAGPRHPGAQNIARALVALAGYFRSGVPGLEMKADPARAAALYRHAGSFFGSVTAQYELARMYLDGEGVNKNVRLAVNWLMNASRKQHAPSQALLGDLLWRGANAGFHQPLNGLALLLMAHERAAGTSDEQWIDQLYTRAAGEASAEQRERAGKIADRWQMRSATVSVPARRSEPATRSAGTIPAASGPQAVPSGIHTVGAAVEQADPR